jgi:hypothetical protein
MYKKNLMLTQLTRRGIRDKIWVKGFALPQLNPADPDSPANLTGLTRPPLDKDFALTYLTRPGPDLTGFPTRLWIGLLP